MRPLIFISVDSNPRAERINVLVDLGDVILKVPFASEVVPCEVPLMFIVADCIGFPESSVIVPLTVCEWTGRNARKMITTGISKINIRFIK